MDNRKKVLLLSEIFPPQTGGSGRWLWEVYRRFPKERVVIAANDFPRSVEFDRKAGIKVIRMPLSLREWGITSRIGLGDYFRAVKRLAKLVKDENVTHLHCGRCIPEGVMALALRIWRSVRYGCYVHGEDVSTAIASREYTLLVRQVLRMADFLIANSQNTAELLHQDWSVPDSKIHIIHPGVDTDVFLPAEASGEARRVLGWEGQRVVLTVGRLQQRKGHDQMIRALPRILKTFPNALYSVVGEGAEREPLEALARDLQIQDRVQFKGEISEAELIQCYQQCDLFILPNREVNGDIEGFGMVLLEAQSCGKAVLAGASGGTAETMRIPDTGLVIPCELTESIETAVLDLMGNGEKRLRMGRLARQWVLERFDWEILSTQALSLLMPSDREATETEERL